MASTPEQLTDAVAYHGEGPCWSPSWGGLRWVDMLAGDLLTLRADGSVDRLHVGAVAAFVRPRTRGGYVVALERGLAVADLPDAVPTPWEPMWTDEGVRMNDGGCDHWGALYAGSMAYDTGEGRGALYRVTPDGSTSVVVPDATISNGIDFVPDGRRAYYNDTATGRTDVFDVVDGALTGRRPFLEPEDGMPDGLTVDSAGNVWTALHGAGAVVCCSPEGRLLDRVEVPAHQVTACTLGGEDLRDLFITTSREGLDDPEPAAGALFRVRVDVPGRPTLPFAG
jgi:sugar lactone lactonase YvrE